MKFSPDKYKYVKVGNKVMAISTYAGKTVKGTAKCDPKDEYDVEFGKTLAAARCNEKVSRRRFNRAKAKFDEATKLYKEAEAHLIKMTKYLNDADDERHDAYVALKDIMMRG